MKTFDATILKIRETADTLKASKEAYGEIAVKTVVKGVEESLAVPTAVLRGLLRSYEMAGAVCGALGDDKALRGQTVDLVAHVIGDVASRINEFATLLEKGSQNPKIQQAAGALMEAVKDLEDLEAFEAPKKKRNRYKDCRFCGAQGSLKVRKHEEGCPHNDMKNKKEWDRGYEAAQTLTYQKDQGPAYELGYEMYQDLRA